MCNCLLCYVLSQLSSGCHPAELGWLIPKSWCSNSEWKDRQSGRGVQCSCLHAQFMLWTFWYIPDILTSHLVEQFDLAVGIVPYYGGSSVLNQCRSCEGEKQVCNITWQHNYYNRVCFFLHCPTELFSPYGGATLFLTGSSCPFTRWLFFCRTSQLLRIVPC